MADLNANQSPDLFTRKWLLVVILCMIPPFVLFAFLGHDPGRGRAASGSTIVIMYAARACWNLRRYTWFWVMLTIFIVVHILLVLLIPWTSKSYPGLILLPIAAMDFGIMYGCIKLAEKIEKKTGPPQSA